MKKEDLTGKKFGRLTAISLDYTNKFGVSCWKFLCDCGTSVVCQRGAVVSGIQVSCGCYHKERLKGRKPPNKLPDGESALNALYGTYSRKAKRRGLTFDIPKENFRILISGNCSYCGVSPMQVFKGEFPNYLYNGIDRVNSNIGYTPDNSVTCCFVCNRAKSTMPLGNFLAWINRIVAFHTKEKEKYVSV
jgi:hypothetical protein